MTLNRRSLLLGTSALALNAAVTGAVIFAPTPALASCQVVSGSDATISGSISCITWESNNVTITGGGTVVGSGTGVDNLGNAVGSLANSGSIGGSNAGVINSTRNGTVGAIAAITNAGTISGNTFGIHNQFGSIGTIANFGVITGDYGILNDRSRGGVAGSIGAVTNATGGVINGNWSGIFNIGTIGMITNSGMISGGTIGTYNKSSIGEINNTIDGVITGGRYGIQNGTSNGSIGTIGIISNSGTISGNNTGISNGGFISSISNTGIISNISSGCCGAGITNYGTIGAITNNGTINSPGNNGIQNYTGTISIITNSIDGKIQGGQHAIYNNTAIGTIGNSGLMNGHTTGIYNSGAIGTISNSGLISGPQAIWSGTSGPEVGTILSAITNTGTIAGNINVAQDLTITGGNASTIGTLTGYQGSIGTIIATNLTLDSAAYQLLDDDVNVGSGSGTVTNSGTLMVNAAHTITGNYLQGTSALLVVGVTDPTHYGDLIVTGNATMTGDHVSITPVSGTLTSGESFTIVQDSTIGTADYSRITATAAGGFTASVTSSIIGGYDDLIVDLSGGGGGGGGTYGSIGGAAGGGVAPAVGAALDQIHAGGDPAFDDIFTALNNLGSISTAAEGAGIKQLAPNQIMPQIAASGLVMDQAMHVVGQHQEGLLAQNGDGSTGSAAGSEYQSGLFWAQASGGVATRDSSADSGGYSQNFYGLTFGVDDHIDKDAALGLALGWMHSNASGSGDLGGDTVSLDSIQITSYGTRRFGQAFVDGMLGIGINLFDERRDIGFLSEQAKANYSGLQFMGRAETGYDFPVSTFTLTPLAGFQAVRTNTDSYTERGAGVADNSVGGQGVNSFATTLGGKVATVVQTAWGSLTPEIKAAWVHDLTNGAITTPAQLGGVSFATTTPRASADGAQVTLAATLKQGDSVSLRAEYDGDLRADYASHTGLVKVEWSF